MRRRTLIAGLSSAAFCLLNARAQPAEPPRRIVLLIPIVPARIQGPLWTFLRQLQALGSTEERNLRIDYRWPGEDVERMRADAEDVAASKPDMIFAHGGPALAAASKATRTTPIVFVQTPDPIEAGFVVS